jgi:glycosyltransferase involved in cell wall biosynthesis
VNLPRIAIIMSGFPRRSETFALNELQALAARGLLAGIFAIKPGDGLSLQPGSEALFSHVQLVPAGNTAAQAAWITARLAGRSVRGVHGYFAHAPTEVAMHVAQRLAIPYSFSVHAKDARKVTPVELTKRAETAACVIACNVDIADYLRQHRVPACLIPHGVDLRRFSPQPVPFPYPLRLLAVGRLVEKKGFATLLTACRHLLFPFELQIIGDGPSHDRLAALVRTNGFADQVTLCGGKTHNELPVAYANAHVIVVPSVEDQAGDRDGLPNVVLEALASGRPVVGSDVGAIATAVAHEKTGLLVPPGDDRALAAALNLLASRPDFRTQLGLTGRRFVEQHYDLTHCTERFCKVLEAVYA